MRRLLPLLLLLALAACQPASPTATPTITQSLNHPITQSPTPTITQSPNHPITQSPNHSITPTPTETPAPPALTELGLSPELQQTLETRQGWTFRWDAKQGVYLISQKEWDADQAAFTHATLGEIGYIDAEGRLHLHSTSFTAVPGENSAFEASTHHDKIVLNLHPASSSDHHHSHNLRSILLDLEMPATSTNTPTPEKKPTQTATSTPEATATLVATPENNATETQLGPFTFIETKNPLFEKTGILTLTVQDENGNPIPYVYSREQKAFVYLPITSFSEKAFLSTPEDELPKNVELGFIPWELLHQEDSPLIGLLIASGYDRPYEQDTRDGLLGYILRFEMGNEWHENDNGSKIAYLRPAYVPEIKNEFIDDPVRWAAKKDEYGDFQRPFFFTITPDGHRIIFTVKQLLNTDGTRLFIPLAIGEIPDDKLSKFIKHFNSKNDRRPQGYINSSFYGIIIASQGDAFPPIKEPYIYSDTVGEGRDIVDSLLAMEKGIMKNIYYGSYNFDFSGDLKNMEANNISIVESPIAEGDKKGNLTPLPVPFELQQLLLGLGF